MTPSPRNPLAPMPARIVAGLLLAFTVLGSLFAAGEAMDDPGGVTGALLVCSWLVPMVVTMGFAWRDPARTQPVLVALAVVLGVASVVAGLSGGWRDLEFERGPIRALVLLDFGGVLGVLALHRHRPAGMVLSALSAVLLVTTLFGAGSAPLRVLAVPLLAAGLLLWALPQRPPAR